jgi:hypothetical protein
MMNIADSTRQILAASDGANCFHAECYPLKAGELAGLAAPAALPAATDLLTIGGETGLTTPPLLHFSGGCGRLSFHSPAQTERAFETNLL